MTNLTAALVITITTNWIPVGSFHAMDGSVELVQRGHYMTNISAIVKWKGEPHEVLLERQIGQRCGERRVPMPDMVHDNWHFTPGVVTTNSLQRIMPKL